MWLNSNMKVIVIVIFQFLLLSNLHAQSVSLSANSESEQALDTEYWVEITLGQDDPAEDVYGVSLKLQADQSTTTYVEGSAEAGDFLGSSVIDFYQTVDAQTLDMAVSKTSGEGASGAGVAMRAKFMSSAEGEVVFSLLDAEVLDSEGNEVGLALSDLTVTIIGEKDTVSIAPVAEPAQMLDTEYWVEITLGEDNPAEDVYGVSLKLQANESTTSYVEGSAEAGDFLGSSVIDFYQAVDAQTLDMAVSKTSGVGASGNGIAMRAKFVSSAEGEVVFSLLDAEVLDNEGNEVGLALSDLTVTIIGEKDTVSIAPVAEPEQMLDTEYWVEITLGEDNPAEDVYGVSLKLQANESTTSYVEGSAEAGDFLGSSVIDFYQAVDAQTVDMAVSKTSGEGASGAGVAMRAKFMSSAEGEVVFSLLDAEVLDSEGNEVGLALSDLTVTIIGEKDTVSIAPVAEPAQMLDTEYWVEITLGEDNPAEDVYGVSLKLQANQSTTSYVEGSAGAGDFLGSSVIDFYQAVDAQTVDMAVSKTSGSGASGSGVAMRAKFVSSAEGEVIFSLLDAEVLDSEGQDVGLDLSSLTITIIGERDTVSISPVAESEQMFDTEYWVEITLGQDNPAEDVYGVSLKLQANQATTSYVEGSAEAGDFLGSSVIDFYQAVDAQTLDMAVSKTSGEGASGAGVAMRAKFVSSVEGEVIFSLLDAEVLDSEGQDVGLDLSSLTITIIGERDTVSISPVAESEQMFDTEYWVEITLGQDNPAEDVYGVSLKLQANQATTSYVEGSAEAGDFLGSSVIDFYQAVDAQTLDMAVSKTSGEGASGAGVAMRAKFVSSAEGEVIFSLLDAEVLDSEGKEVNVDISDLVVEIIIVSNESENNSPKSFQLSQNYPNPFNPSTNISFSIPEGQHISLKVFDISGREVATLVDGFRNVGEYSVSFNASNLSSGVYFYRLETADFTQTRRMLLIK